MRDVDGPLMVLAGGSGWLDAATYLHLHVFTANMSGNTVLLALTLVTPHGKSFETVVYAVAAFALGTFLGTALDAGRPPVRGARNVLMIEAILLGIVAAFWWLLPSATFLQRIALIAAGALAMGMQQAATVRLHPAPPASTTYMSGVVERIGANLWGFIAGSPKPLIFNGLMWLIFVGAAYAAGKALPQASALFAVVPFCTAASVVATLWRRGEEWYASADTPSSTARSS